MKVQPRIINQVAAGMLLLFLAGCSSPQSGSNTPRTVANPPTLPDTQHIAAGAALVKKADQDTTGADANPGPTLGEVLDDYHKECRDTVRVDTNLVYKGNYLKVSFRHYSTNDSMIRLPQTYCKLWGLKEFIGHDFESSLRVRTRDSILLDTIIRNNIFNSYVQGNLPDLPVYGTLFCSGRSSIQFLPDRIRVDYSYSIALTDIGVAVHLEYRYLGKLKTLDEYH
jgi:hypothetical protein